METLRNLSTLLRRLQGSVQGSRVYSLLSEDRVRLVQVIDDVSGLTVPMQRTVLAAQITATGVAGRFNWIEIAAISKPVRVLYFRPSLGGAAGVFATSIFAGGVANRAGVAPDWWEGGPTQLGFVPLPGTVGSGLLTSDGAGTIFGTNPISPITTPMESKLLPILMPGQSFVCGTNTVATSQTAQLIWEEFQEIEGGASAP